MKTRAEAKPLMCVPVFPSSAVVLDDCNFHESVQLDSFETERMLVLTPPDGEFVAMNYRTSSEFKPPFRVVAQIDETAPYKVEVVLRLIADFPVANAASTVVVSVPLPKTTSHVSLSTSGAPGQARHRELQSLLTGSSRALPQSTAALGAVLEKEWACFAPADSALLVVRCVCFWNSFRQTAEFLEQQKALQWTFRKVQGGSDHILRAKVALTQERQSNVRKEARWPVVSACTRQCRPCGLAQAAAESAPPVGVLAVRHGSAPAAFFVSSAHMQLPANRASLQPFS